MSKRDELLDLAELAIRKSGFEGVSFRDLAAQAGIKSASVHYHFPTKADLGEAVVERYRENLLAALGEPDDPAHTPKDRVARLIATYAGAYQVGPCLCVVMGSVMPLLPDDVQASVNRFFTELLEWTTTALQGLPDAETLAPALISLMQGAMVLGTAQKNSGQITQITPAAYQLCGLTP